MQTINSPTTVAQTFWPVKSPELITFGTPPNPMIHHKVTLSHNNKLIVSYSNTRGKPYGVSRSRRAITSSLFIKKFDYIRDCLKDVLKLTPAQREVTLRLLRLWSYYGLVYPKASMVTDSPGCSKATYWRTIRLLKDAGLIEVLNRYVIRPHAQISNLYRLDRLALLLARYLAEHGVAFWEKWLRPALTMPGQEFWSQIYSSPGDRVVPWRLAAQGFSIGNASAL